jgi:PAS domain S-box-containing protein
MASTVFDSDALYRLLVTQVEDYAIFALDTEGHVRTWNPGAERLKGYTAQEIIGQSFTRFYPPEARAAGRPQMLLAEAARTGHASDEGWRVRKDGSRFWASVLITALHDDDGKHVGFAKITRDLTARRESEERARKLAAEESAHTASRLLTVELEQANEQLQETLADAEDARDALAAAERFARGILESIADPFVVLGPDWTYQFVNPPAARMIAQSPGQDAERIVGRSVWDAYPEILGTDFERQMRRAASERVAVTFEAKSPRRSLWSLLHCYPLPDGGLAMQWRDITKQKRAEEAARFLAQAGDVFNQSLDYETTIDQVARLVVPTLADWCSVQIADDNGTLRPIVVAHVDPSKVDLARRLDADYPADGNASFGAYNVLRTGKPELYTEIPDELLVAGAHDAEHLRISRELGLNSAMVVPLSVEGGTRGVMTLVAAESGRRYDEQDLELAMGLAHRVATAVQNAELHRAAREAQRMAEDANRAKSEFLATMSHELRTPLNAIAGYVDLLRLGIRGPINAEQSAYLDRIERSEKYLLSLIHDVLSFAKIEAGRIALTPQVVHAGAVLDDVASLMRPQFADARVHFDVEECPPSLTAFADPERLRQILLNLLTNAVKFTPAGGRVRMSCREEDDSVCFSVEDSGSGIPPDKQESIFQPFVQLGRYDSSGKAGSGLGLAISRDLARAMDGDVSVESEVGRGSTFTLTLPRQAVRSLEEEALQP